MNIVSGGCVYPPTLSVAPKFLAVLPFPTIQIWFAGIYARGCIHPELPIIYCGT